MARGDGVGRRLDGGPLATRRPDRGACRPTGARVPAPLDRPEPGGRSSAGPDVRANRPRAPCPVLLGSLRRAGCPERRRRAVRHRFGRSAALGPARRMRTREPSRRAVARRPPQPRSDPSGRRTPPPRAVLGRRPGPRPAGHRVGPTGRSPAPTDAARRCSARARPSAAGLCHCYRRCRRATGRSAACLAPLSAARRVRRTRSRPVEAGGGPLPRRPLDRPLRPAERRADVGAAPTRGAPIRRRRPTGRRLPLPCRGTSASRASRRRARAVRGGSSLRSALGTVPPHVPSVAGTRSPSAAARSGSGERSGSARGGASHPRRRQGADRGKTATGPGDKCPAGPVSTAKSGGVLLSQGESTQVPSALVGLTSVFGMGTGATPPL